MITLDQALDFSTYANYGKNQDLEIFSEVALYILTGLKSVPYYREMGTQVRSFENKPIQLEKQITVAIQILQSVQKYNDDVNLDDGDRRVALSFDDIEFDDTNRQAGELDTKILYTPLKDLKPVAQSL